MWTIAAQPEAKLISGHWHRANQPMFVSRVNGRQLASQKWFRMRLILLLPALSILLQRSVAQSSCSDVHFKTIPSATLTPTTTTQLNLIRQRDGSYTSYERSTSSPYGVVSIAQHFENRLSVCLPSSAPALNPAPPVPANPAGASSQPQAIALLISAAMLSRGSEAA
jgi:hypothetical protein